MSLSPDQVRQVAHLARLELKTEQVDKYAGELTRIFDLVGQLAKAQTASVSPMAHPLDMTQRLRPDAVSDGDRRDAFQSIAPQVKEGLYLVPKVIE
ncbi:MAG TPA: Asp-tRNA(Asn)/Glu-tRNA(Gln) amidotransferase subunit GatC [Candidatus Binatia bacterium]|nr:Asp-tRNA(Asn)/Glu-tRNA(Gln) amidotransferase subunit GatC [Candidatus Binatia bacterium]